MTDSSFDERILRIARDGGIGIKPYSHEFVVGRVRKIFPLGTQVSDARIKAAIADLRTKYRDQFIEEIRDYRRESPADLLDRANAVPPKTEKTRVGVTAAPKLTPEQRVYLSSLSPARKLAVISGDLPWPLGLRGDEAVPEQQSKIEEVP